MICLAIAKLGDLETKPVSATFRVESLWSLCRSPRQQRGTS